jgi:hypothetical protein
MRHFQVALYCLVLIPVLMVSGCHNLEWTSKKSSKNVTVAPSAIESIFEKAQDRTLEFEAVAPGYDYGFDIGEKAQRYSSDDGDFRYTTVRMTLHEKMRNDQVLVDVQFIDKQQNVLHVNTVDLLRFIPVIDATDDLQYGEYMLEEFNRFGLNFRREHKEFTVEIKSTEEPVLEAAKEIYRLRIVNNCLAPRKFELELYSQDYSDFKARRTGPTNINQNKILAHSWFFLDADLYAELLKLKNPNLSIDPTLPYDSLSNRGEQVVVNYELLRNPIRKKIETEVVEVGHQTERSIAPLDIEQFYKEMFGLHLNRTADLTYKSILEAPQKTTRFLNQGFYNDTVLGVFDFSWMNYVDQVEIAEIDLSGTEAYVEITLTGEWAPYEIRLGNVDLSLLSEQSLTGFLFGVNTYPKNRRYNPKQSTIAFDADLLPKDQRPYLLLHDKKTGKWINNQYKGIEKVYLSYETLEHDVLNIYVLSYERITPVWMARVKLPTTTREAVRVRRRLYNY